MFAGGHRIEPSVKREDNFINVAKHARALTMIEVLRCQRDADLLGYSYGRKCRRSAAWHLTSSKNLAPKRSEK